MEGHLPPVLCSNKCIDLDNSKYVARINGWLAVQIVDDQAVIFRIMIKIKELYRDQFYGIKLLEKITSNIINSGCYDFEIRDILKRFHIMNRQRNLLFSYELVTQQI